MHAGGDVRPGLFLIIAAACGTAACGPGAEHRGHELYADRGCAVCHGASGRGDGPAAKRLDTPPSDLSDARAYRNGPSQESIAASIRNGVGAMPAFRDLTNDEAMDIAAWITALQRQNTGASGRQP